MISRAFEGLLPGLRDFRTPLVAGALWGVAIWLKWGVGFSSSSDPRIEEARSFVEDAPDVVVVGLVGAVIYVVGLLANNVAQGVAAFVSHALKPWFDWSAWVGHAHSERDSKRERVEREKLMLWQSKRRGAKDKQIESRQAELDKAQAKYDEVRTIVKRRWSVPRRNPDSVGILGEPIRREPTIVAQELVDSAHESGYFEGLQAVDSGLDSRRSGSSSSIRTDEVLSELEPDPLDIVFSRDQSFYQVLDRERSEREFRVAVAVPSTVIGAYVGVEISPWSWIVVGAAVFVFIQAASQIDPSVRVLRFLGATNGSPAIEKARLEGRQDAAHVHRQPHE